MKRTLALLPLLAFIALAAKVPVADDPDSFGAVFDSIVDAYPGTKPASLPMLEERALIKRPQSSAPGRMHLPRNLVIDKDRMRAKVINAFGDELFTGPVCASRNRGQKRTKDDCCTPEGTFRLYGMYNSTDWTYEDTDDKCYGPWFLSLMTPRYWGVGVHGTNNPSSVPGRRSHGCVRMHNEDIIKVKALVQKDFCVTVLPDVTNPPEPALETEAVDYGRPLEPAPQSAE